ncbi:DNA repair protein rhp57 [Cytospora mali]|uniref:DNA repair protein rhp57 n=1 Tax=Cytospora mali TaxID=578113 RepID=A0A194V9Z8_CYTMA|nr:DNA repair protein rhp57 [Valsa mali var. pyri (nom. inval.)]
MTDLLRVLPHFPTSQYASLIQTLEKHQVTTSELLTLEVADLGKRTQLPLLDLKRLCNAVLDALHSDLEVSEKGNNEAATAAGGDNGTEEEEEEQQHETSRHSFSSLKSRWKSISTLDPGLDASLGGGIPTGYITELTGESGAGKTQFLLSLLLAVQLPPPHGTGRNALYISTEAPLSTRRLTQMLNNNPLFKSVPISERPSLDNILSTTTPDLESQEHILTYQVPVEVERRDIGLIVLDSVAANYRAEFDRSVRNDSGGLGPGGEGGKGAGQNMGARSAELVRLGMLLRDLARNHNLAVVVSNQVADRFDRGGSPAVWTAGNPPARSYGKNFVGGGGGRRGPAESSPLASRSKNPDQVPLPHVEPTSSMADALPRSSMSHGDIEDEGPPSMQAPPPPSMADEIVGPPAPPALNFDHQQRWFTGWGDDPNPSSAQSLKTPSLGLVWATQIACRIALFKAPRYGKSKYAEDDDAGGTGTLKTWRRWMKVVFAPHVAAMGPGLDECAEFEITMDGLKGVTR